MVHDTVSDVTDTVLEHLACRDGYLPVPLRCVPPDTLTQLEVHLLRGDNYPLYRGIEIQFGVVDRDRLLASGVEFVYISTRDHQHYYRTIEDNIAKIVSDPHIQQQKKAEILYSTSLELSNQLLESPPDKDKIERIENISGATVQYVLSDQDAFARLFEVSNHDFYTATHMVNVCTYAVVLARRMGLDDKAMQDLATGCLLHDVGKIFVPSALLNDTQILSDEQFHTIQSHVEQGYEYLRKVSNLSAGVLSVVAQHHERMDSSGYPYGLSGAEISQFGRIVGVADTFEAMTAVRPYRRGVVSVQDALAHLHDRAGEKYDPHIVGYFAEMINDRVTGSDEPSQPRATANHTEQIPRGRQHERHFFRLTVTVRKIQRRPEGLTLAPPTLLIAHNISRSGVGLISSQRLRCDENILVTIGFDNTEAVTNLAAVVIRSVDHHNGWYTVGVQFHQVQNPGLIEQLRHISLAR